MRKGFTASAISLFFTMLAVAEDAPRMETFVGYTYVRANSATNIPAFSANGGSAQFVYNFNKWLGGVADAGAVHNGNIGGVHIDDALINYLFGPRYTARHARLSPYVQILFGGADLRSSSKVDAILVAAPHPLSVNTTLLPGQPITARYVAAQTGFAMTAGGGLDISINHWASFRPVQLEYFLTRLQNLRTANDNDQHNLRYSAGVNFTFGGAH